MRCTPPPCYSLASLGDAGPAAGYGSELGEVNLTALGLERTGVDSVPALGLERTGVDSLHHRNREQQLGVVRADGEEELMRAGVTSAAS
jgi:hypothetical protein